MLLLDVPDREEVPAFGHDHSRSFAAQKPPPGEEADGPALLPGGLPLQVLEPHL